MVTKHGVQWYMMGDYASRMMADIGAYLPPYYKSLEAIKRTLDPKFILSRGKYNLWGDGQK
jgi:hypothetical protein